MHPSIHIIDQIEPRKPILVAAWPGMGNVAFGAAMYLKEYIGVHKFAEIAPENVFHTTGVQIKDGIVEIPSLPRSEFFFHYNREMSKDLIIFLGESQPVMEKEYELARRVVEVAVHFRVSEIITFAATPVNITHHTEPGVWGVATSVDILNKLPSIGVKVMNAGHIGGLNGLLLGVAMESGLKGVCFLGEIPFYTAKIENPRSSMAVLKSFMSYTGINIDLSGLIQMSRFVEEEIDRVSKATKQTLFEAESHGPGEDEKKIEEERRGQKSIPGDVRERIEDMFEIASHDISRAGELKKELDKWGVFSEYEDRFLDLFGKKNM